MLVEVCIPGKGEWCVGQVGQVEVFSAVRRGPSVDDGLVPCGHQETPTS